MNSFCTCVLCNFTFDFSEIYRNFKFLRDHFSLSALIFLFLFIIIAVIEFQHPAAMHIGKQVKK